jgi:phage terminase large subunit-like protein
MQADIAHFKEEMKRLNYRFPIIPLGGNTPKPDRIKRLIPVFEQGRMFIPDMCWRVNYEGQQQDLTKIFIDEEYLAFPVATHDDMLDGLSRIVDANLGASFPRTGRAAHRSTTADRDYNPHAV